MLKSPEITEHPEKFKIRTPSPAITIFIELWNVLTRMHPELGHDDIAPENISLPDSESAFCILKLLPAQVESLRQEGFIVEEVETEKGGTR